MKAPLIILTTCFSIAFLDGVFGWGLADGFYTLLGFAMMLSVGWLWMIESKM